MSLAPLLIHTELGIFLEIYVPIDIGLHILMQ